MNIRIRTYPDQPKRLQLCKHVEIDGVKTQDEFPKCEYTDTVNIYCTKCKITHSVTICVN